MRRFTDVRGESWEVVVGRESWGVFVALFVPVERDDAVRQAPLLAAGYDAANAELEALDEPALRDLVGRALPITLGA
jgi:hypothetical protein